MAAPRRDRQTPAEWLLEEARARGRALAVIARAREREGWAPEARERLLGAGYEIERAAALIPLEETLKHELRILLGRLRGMAERLELEP